MIVNPRERAGIEIVSRRFRSTDGIIGDSTLAPITLWSYESCATGEVSLNVMDTSLPIA
jgi:hypothetical protein